MPDKKFNIGDRVRINGTLLYDGRIGVLTPTSDDPEDFWDFNVDLDALSNPKSLIEQARTIGVHDIDLEKIEGE